MTKQVRLKPHEAIALGFKVRKTATGIGNPNYRLTESQIKELKKIREFHETEFTEVKRTLNKDGEVISKVERLVAKQLVEIPINHEIIGMTTNPSINQQWIRTRVIDEKEFFEEKTFEEIKQILIDEFSKIIKVEIEIVNGSEIANIVIADLHLGAYIDGLVNTKDYSIPILIQYLESIVISVNRLGYKEVNVLFLGDMIESFTGLNHKNSWKGLQKGMIGAEVIKFSVNILHEKLLSKIKNLKKVKLVAGNHDRLTSDKDEDTDGGACDLIAFGLELRGYDVEFHPTVISVEIDGINYILLHGHKGISRRATKDICWDFGKK
jgi:predicted phosphodiesterase